MITTNYSARNNNYQPNFGKYDFYDAAKVLLKKKLNTPEKVAAFQRLCESEAVNERKIPVAADGSRLTAQPGNGWITQKFWQSITSFLGDVSAKARKYNDDVAFQKHVENVVDICSK